MFKKSLVIIFSLVFCNIISAQEDNNFIVSATDSKISKQSKNSMKEDIGQTIKEALNHCADLNKQIGKIQIELADIQKNLFAKIEELIDDKRPFKKASRSDLTEALVTIKSVNSEVSRQVENVMKIETQINKSKCLKRA